MLLTKPLPLHQPQKTQRCYQTLAAKAPSLPPPWPHICGTRVQPLQQNVQLVWLDWLMLKQGNMGGDLQEAYITMFCNGDVEERLTKWQ